MTTKWFGVRCLFQWNPARWAKGDEPKPAHIYEERVTIWQSASVDAAIELAEDEAARYSADNAGIEYIGLAQSYWLADVPGQGAEVFSLLRDSDLGPDAYIDHFFDTGGEHQEHAEDG